MVLKKTGAVTSRLSQEREIVNRLTGFKNVYAGKYKSNVYEDRKGVVYQIRATTLTDHKSGRWTYRGWHLWRGRLAPATSFLLVGLFIGKHLEAVVRIPTGSTVWKHSFILRHRLASLPAESVLWRRKSAREAA